jgi:glycyl-tRNA synthetase beta chain
METKDFLLEIGVEEIPAGYIRNAVDRFGKFFSENLAKLDLKYEDITLYSTPRRIGIKIKELQTRQADRTIEKTGPSVRAAYESDGNLTRAAQGFLKNSGADINDIYTVQTAKGDKIAVKFEEKGSETGNLLQELIPEALSIIPFPKTMKWNEKDFSFARPIRWLLILLGDETLDLQFRGLKADNFTYGNRFLSLDNKIIINKISDYQDKLTENYVIADRADRKKLLQAKIEKLMLGSNNKLIEDDKLLDTVTDLVEYPEPVIAEFNSQYLILPEKIITNTLSQHQKYFSIAGSNDELSNKFLFVSNGDPRFNELIKLGNEKVIKARLDDAEFFYNEDIKIPFEEYVPRLAEVTFQEKLGSVLEKTGRIEKIAEYLSQLLKLPDFVKQKTLRTARLCKADLVTLMLGEKEFTKLQGYIGWKYAERSKEIHPVPLAIFEHYLPRWQNDILPDSMEGSVVAIADKLDTICGIIGVDMIPTGSKDPFALRRAANGVVQIIAEKGFNVHISDLIEKVYSSLEAKLKSPQNNIDFVKDFMKQRINWFLQEKGITYDVIDSVMHIDHNLIPDLMKRATALQTLKASRDFINLVTGFKRVSNIIENYNGLSSVQEDLFIEDAEKKLYKEYLLLKDKIDYVLQEKKYEKVLELLIDFGKIIDEFFDTVLVNVDQEEIRKNRYELLLLIRKLFLNVADLSKIVIDGN